MSFILIKHTNRRSIGYNMATSNVLAEVDNDESVVFSTGIPVQNTMVSSLSTLPKTLLVVIMYPIDLLFVCLTKRKDTFIPEVRYR